MTAIKTGAAGNKGGAGSSSTHAPSGVEAQHARPLHPSMALQNGRASHQAPGRSEASRPTRVSGRAPSRSSVVDAKARFVAATTSAMSKLTARGYGRESAAILLLREMGRGDSPPTDQEVFNVMKSMGLGMEEASRVATVSRAVQRARRQQGLSAVEAIDDLTSRLSASQLFGGETMSAPPPSSRISPRERPRAALPNRVAPKKSQATKKKGKTPSRKRQLSHTDDQNITSASNSVRPPNDPVDTALAHKQKLAKKSTNNDETNSAPKPAPSSVVAARSGALKRTVPHHPTDDTPRAQSPPMKRTRGSSAL